MTSIGALGTWPGTAALPAQQQVLDALGDPPSGVDGVPHLVTLPGRGPGGEAVGRALAVAESLPATLEPHGWRLGLVGDRTQDRARAWLREDVEVLGLVAAGYGGRLVLPVLGPWSIAASVWLPRGERIVGDEIAVRDVVESLAAGVHDHVAEVGRALGTAGAAVMLGGRDGGREGGGGAEAAGAPAPRFTVLVAEPRLDLVLRGAVPSFSGVPRLAAIEPGVVTGALRSLAGAWRDVADVVVAVPPDAASIRAVAAAGVHGIAVDVPALDDAAWEAVAEAAESGVGTWAGIAAPRADDRAPEPDRVARVVLDPWRRVGLATDLFTRGARGAGVVLTPRAGLAGVSPQAARATLDDVARAAVALAELLA